MPVTEGNRDESWHVCYNRCNFQEAINSFFETPPTSAYERNVYTRFWVYDGPLVEHIYLQSVVCLSFSVTGAYKLPPRLRFVDAFDLLLFRSLNVCHNEA